MSLKQYGVFGLGEFGRAVAVALAERGCQVLAVDKNENHVALVADHVTVAVTADIHDVETIQSLDIGRLDGAIICCGDDIGSNIMGIALAKEADIQLILAKAMDDRTANIYRKLGATDIVFPEMMMGKRVANGILSGKFLDYMELSKDFGMAELVVPASWHGKSLMELNVRQKYHVNVIARKVGSELNMVLDPMRKFKAGDTYLVVGEHSALENLK